MNFQPSLDRVKNQGLYRARRILPQSELINFCSNDYLGLSKHPLIVKAFNAAALDGFGSGASALSGGYHAVHAELERRFAEFLQRDRVILFNSGYHANIGVITALANRRQKIFVDKLCHASIIDGILLSRAAYQRYAHNDVDHLSHCLKISSAAKPLIITESVFSMEGTIAPVNKLADLAEQYSGTLIVDDAHGIGVLGKTGRGVCEYAGLNQQRLPILISPLGKAFGGMGALVSGSAEFIEFLLQFSRTYRYTTALPPAIAAALIAALDVVSNEVGRLQRLIKLINFFKIEAVQRKLPLLSCSSTPIQPILIGDNQRVVELQNQLQRAGVAVVAIRPPTVAAGTARLRISLSCEHTQQQIIKLLDLLVENGVGNS